MCIRIRPFGTGPPSVHSAGFGNSGRWPFAIYKISESMYKIVYIPRSSP